MQVRCSCQLSHESNVSAFKRPSRRIENGIELFSHVVTIGGLLLSVLVKLGSKGTFSIMDKLALSTCEPHQL